MNLENVRGFNAVHDRYLNLTISVDQHRQAPLFFLASEPF